jgi:uracil-DNA glycosylase
MTEWNRLRPLHEWTELPFFKQGRAETILSKIAARHEQGIQILPAANDVFNALNLTPLSAVKVVILGQDPYPTPGDAHGLAFSYKGKGHLPASLKNIFKEMALDLNIPMPKIGDLTSWAKQGVLLLNKALTTEAGLAGAHLKWGWQELVNEVVAAVSAHQPHVVFLLWGASARACAGLINPEKHLILESGHPSPLNRLGDFAGTRPFSRTNEWLTQKGLPQIDWSLPS